MFKAAVMEEKWDVYRRGNYLYFTRSWTGDLVFAARIRVYKGLFALRRVYVPQTQTLCIQSESLTS
jgi:hypothetical protein